MAELPNRIWLQWYGDGDPEDGTVSEGDVSWCRDKIFDHDIEYTRATPTDAAVRACAEEIAENFLEGGTPREHQDIAAIITKNFKEVSTRHSN